MSERDSANEVNLRLEADTPSRPGIPIWVWTGLVGILIWHLPYYGYNGTVLLLAYFSNSPSLVLLFALTFTGCMGARIGASFQAKSQINDVSYEKFQLSNHIVSTSDGYLSNDAVAALGASVVATLAGVLSGPFGVVVSLITIFGIFGWGPWWREMKLYRMKRSKLTIRKNTLQNKINITSDEFSSVKGNTLKLVGDDVQKFYSLSSFEEAISQQMRQMRQLKKLAKVYKRVVILSLSSASTENHKPTENVITAIEQFDPSGDQASVMELKSRCQEAVLSLLIADVVERQRFQLQQKVLEHHEAALYVNETELVDGFLQRLHQSQLNEQTVTKLRSDRDQIINKIHSQNNYKKSRIHRTKAEIRKVKQVQRIEAEKEELQRITSAATAAPGINVTRLHNCIEHIDSSQLALAQTRLDACRSMLELFRWTDTLAEEHGLDLSGSDTVLEINELLREQDGSYPFFYSDIDRLTQLQRRSDRVLEFLSQNNNTTPYIDSKINKTIIVEAVENAEPERLQSAVEFIEESSGYVWSMSDLYDLSWEKFEHLIGYLYRDKGYNVTVTQSSADFGVDVWATRDGKRVAIQVKQFAQGNTVGRRVIQSISSHLATGDADKVVVVTSSSFAATATDWATRFGDNMELINGEKLRTLLSESSLTPEQIDQIY